MGAAADRCGTCVTRGRPGDDLGARVAWIKGLAELVEPSGIEPLTS